MISVEQLSKKYGSRWAIKNLNFEIQKGDVVGLLGPNGAGKSTTMKILTGYMSPTSGQATVCGFNIFENPMEVKKRVGYLPENPPLYTDMTVADYLVYVAQLKKTPKKDIPNNVKNAITKTQLESVEKRLIKNLSKGFKQRVGIAQALVSNPEVLVLDEPTVGLDPKQVLEIRQLIQELKGNHTIILSTHILSEVQAACNKVIIIHQGNIVAQDYIENLDAQMTKKNIVRVVTARAGDVKGALSQVSGVISVESKNENEYLVEYENKDSIIDQIALCLINHKFGIEEISKERGHLEDIFMNLTYNQGR